MSLLKITEPQTYIFIIVIKIIRSSSVLLIKQPLPFVSFAISKSKDTITLTFTF